MLKITGNPSEILKQTKNLRQDGKYMHVPSKWLRLRLRTSILLHALQSKFLHFSVMDFVPFSLQFMPLFCLL